jgi:hypothetical protein
VESVLALKLYAFTDSKGAAVSCFSAQKWVVTPMVGVGQGDRLMCGAFESLEVDTHLRTRSY